MWMVDCLGLLSLGLSASTLTEQWKCSRLWFSLSLSLSYTSDISASTGVLTHSQVEAKTSPYRLMYSERRVSLLSKPHTVLTCFLDHCFSNSKQSQTISWRSAHTQTTFVNFPTPKVQVNTRNITPVFKVTITSIFYIPKHFLK
jgi:hypothetical protein